MFSLVTPERTVQVAQQMAVREELAAEASFRVALPLVVAIPLAWLLLNLIVSRIFGRLARVAEGIAGRAPPTRARSRSSMFRPRSCRWSGR